MMPNEGEGERERKGETEIRVLQEEWMMGVCV